jgi:hypothetical protein
MDEKPATVEIDGKVYPLLGLELDADNPRNFVLRLGPPSPSVTSSPEKTESGSAVPRKPRKAGERSR